MKTINFKNSWSTFALTSQQAIAVGNSEIWEQWSEDQIVRFQLFQDVVAIPFDRYHQALQSLLNRPVTVMEFGNSDKLQKEYLKKNAAPTVLEMLTLLKTSDDLLSSITNGLLIE